ncbi:MAG: hypothetical protein IJH04_10605 [Eggerthellaceae bacterium]|nr:hypothetical protein [Eggerthellaceae bacterium]
MNQIEFAELLSKTLAVFQWAIHKKYGASREDFCELYLLMTLKLSEPDGFAEIIETLKDLGLEVECEF